MISKRTVISRTISQSSITSKSVSFTSRRSLVDQFPYICAIDAEPLHRYRRAGYHPVMLGSSLNNGRYKILHKLGWGGYSTVWAARDNRLYKLDETYVAVKISVSVGQDEDNRELRAMRKLASIHPSSLHIIRMLDDFKLEGPNGIHQCLVFELLGPSILGTIDQLFFDAMLPGKHAKTIAKQALLGLDILHQHKIGHGDLHTGNLVFTIPCMDSLPEEEFIEILGKPDIGHVQRKDGKALDPGMPGYIVRPASYTAHSQFLSNPIKIVDFGESFLRTSIPQSLHTPLPVRAPEVVFRDRLDYRVDLWSMGCMLFELFTGQPPFNSFMITPPILVRQMQEMASDCLPERWQDSIGGKTTTEVPSSALQNWLEELYFDSERSADLTKKDIVQLGQLVGKLLQFEPGKRASAREILDNPWFKCDSES